MPILSIQTSQTGEAGVLPSYASILTSDTEATVLTAGYLNKAVQNGASFALPCIAKISTQASSTSDYQVGWYQIVHSGTDWSVTPAGSPGDVTLPTIANHMAVFSNTTGTLVDDVATAINGGNIQAGLSGTAGTLASFPSTAAKGSLKVAAVANTGDTAVTISNAAHGQASVYTIPDVGAATGGILVSTTALRTKIVAGAAAAGGAAAQSFTDAFCTSASCVIGNWNTQTNAASVLKIVPGNGSFVVTSSADAGVGTFNYIIAKA